MQKSRKTMVISFLVTLVLLFGGFVGYQQIMIKEPIVAFLEDRQEVQLADIHVTPAEVEISLNIKNPEQDFFIRKYPDLLTSLKKKAKGKTLQIHLIDQPNERLHKAWEQMVFSIREGIEKQTYSQIPETVKQWADKNGVQYRLKMDEESVYVMLCDGDKFLVRVIPVKIQKQKGGELFG